MASELASPRGSKLLLLPNEILQNIVSLLTQPDLVTLTITSKLFYKLATRVLYSKIYLNDSVIELSDVCELASTWSWLRLKPSTSNEESRNEANYKLECLLRSLHENPQLANGIMEVRLNWDLEVSLQKSFVEFITNCSQSLRIIENVTDPALNSAIDSGYYSKNLISLDLPPPNPLPSLEITRNYIPDSQAYLRKRLTNIIRVLTLFMDPLLMFNNLVSPKKKLEIESLKLHCRADTYPGQIYNRHNWKFDHLNQIFDTRYLKVLTIISWYDHVCPDRVYKFDQWADFTNLEDITLIAVTYNDKKISNLINKCHKLKRLKLDFSFPRRAMAKNSLVFKSIFTHKDQLQFLDIKLNLTSRIINLDVREFKIMLKVPCKCSLCQDRVLNGILRGKILPTPDDYKINNMDVFQQIDFFDQLFESSLAPYSKAVDRYPSVKTGPDNIQDFLERFNKANMERSPTFIPLLEQDFYDLSHCFIHSIKSDIEPLLTHFKRLKFLVVNDISLIIKEDESTGLRYPVPVFYSRGFKTNFETKSSIQEDLEPYGRPLYIN